MKLGLKISVTLIVMFAILTPVGIYFLNSYFKPQLVKLISDNYEGIAVDKMAEIDRVLYERTLDIKSLAQNPTYIDILSGKELPTDEAKLSIERTAQISGPWNELHIVNTDGVIVLSTNDSEMGDNINEFPYQYQTFQSLSAGETYVSDAILDPTQKRPSLFFASYIRDESAPTKPIVGAVIGDYSWPVIEELLKTNGSEMYLLNKDGILIATNENKTYYGRDMSGNSVVREALQGVSGSGIGVDLLGEHQDLYGFAPQLGLSDFQGDGWVLMVSTDLSSALSVVSTAARRTIYVTLPLSLLINFILIIVLSKVFISPVRKLTEVTQSISSGDFSKRVKISSKDEFGTLSASFNKMADLLTSQIKATKKEQAKLIASINNLPLGFVLTDNNNEILLSNPEVKKMFNLKESWKCDDIEKQLKNFKISKMCEVSRNNKKVVEEKEVEFSDGRFMRIFVSPVVMFKENEEVIGSVILLEDITEAKLLSRTRDEFFALASHELRTPLTSIRGNSSLIIQYFSDQIKNKDLKNMLDDIYVSSIRLIEIVEDFLDTSRLEQGKVKYKMEAFDIVKLAQESIRQVEKMASGKGLSIKLDQKQEKLPKVLADKDRTKQILINLLGNGIKFTKDGGVTVTVTQEDNKVKVSVTDTGVGIKLKNQKMLFRKFVQTGEDTLTRDATQGTGLGLYISKLLVEEMGGNIYLEKSEEGKGSTFTFTLQTESK